MAAEFQYGSDEHGLVWGYLFLKGAPARVIGSAEAEEWLSRTDRTFADGFLWLHFSLTNAGCEEWLRKKLALPESFYESLHAEVGSTRLEQQDDSLVAVVHDVLFDFAFDAGAVSTLCLCIQPHIMVSARRRPLRSVDELREQVKRGGLYQSPADLLAHLLREQADVLVDIVRKSTVKVNSIEDKLLANRISVSRAELGSLRRMLVRLVRLLAPEPAALFRLLARPPRWINDSDLQDLRHAAEEFSAAVDDSAVLVERVKVLQEELSALMGEQTNRTLFVLTVVTVLAIPFTVVTGLFGMNVGGVPLINQPSGFYIVLGWLTVFTAILAVIILRQWSKG